MKSAELKIPKLLWSDLILELRQRGHSRRESGAFLLARESQSSVSDFVCFDDLDSEALESGIITFHAIGFMKLWQICRERGLRVIADVHTHPDEWTGQSFSDRTNPMINQPGHVALIVPHYAQSPEQDLCGVGIYEYRGNHRWKRFSPNQPRVQIYQDEN